MTFPHRRTLAVGMALLLAVAALIGAMLLGRHDPTTAPAAAPTAEPPSATTLVNGTQFQDTDGAPIQAHGGGLLEHEGTYYWVGEDRGEDNRFKAVSLYSSSDLVTWTHRDDILTTASDPELDGATIERPKLLFNERTQQFVLWMHWENGEDYTEARTAVATSSDVDGDYTYKGSFRPLGYESRDQTVFQDKDGTAYLVSATASNADLNIYRLNSEYTRPEELVTQLWPGAFREAPAMFERDGVYFLVTSGATGWDPNQARYATATDLVGPWSELTDVGDSETFGSQPAYVLPVTGSEGTSYLYLGDRWAGARGGLVNDSDYVWLPLSFPTPDTLSMAWTPFLGIDTTTGAVTIIGTTSPTGQ